ncbi:MAG: glutamate--tRNA ligase [Desulfomonilaceae bacterium]
MIQESETNFDPVRVRFAPSPTGYLHIGGARTALYNWLWARKCGGVFILRVEDTDLERSTQDSVQEILEGLKWLGLDWDEGPYFQTHNLEKHKEAAAKLVREGHAYHCFCSKEDLDKQRKQAEANKTAFMYDGRCRKLEADEVMRKMAAGMPSVIRFKVPRDSNPLITFEDAVYGKIEKRAKDIEDFVILRSDQTPLYILSNAVDDSIDRITHVIRGADGLANTPKQILIYHALGIKPPIFAHMPLTLDNKKAKLSKRVHGEVVTISYYRRKGFLPWALCNFLALLGWSSEDGREFFTKEELIQSFDLSRINRHNSIFNYIPGDAKNWTDPKAIHFNATYIRTMAIEDLVPYVKNELEENGLWTADYETTSKDWFLNVVDLIRSRYHVVADFSSKGRFCFSEDFEFDPKAVKKNLCSDPNLVEYLPELAGELNDLRDFDVHEIENVFRNFADRKQCKAGLLINAARTAVSGSSVGPGLFELLAILGKDRVVRRLNDSVKLIGAV